MTIKSFEIDYDGRKEQIEYEDDIAFGDFETVRKVSVDLSNVTKPSVDIEQYRIQILLKTLRKAPFNYLDVREIRKQKSSVIRQIMMEVMKDYPLVVSLEDWMVSFMGEEEINLESKSTPSAQPPSDGTNAK